MRAKRLTPDKQHFFFGYYDKSPWNLSENKLLVGNVSIVNVLPRQHDTLKVGYVNLNEGQFHSITDTYAWNFQQGCMLQWLSDEKFIFNQVADKKAYAQIYSITTNTFVDLPMPIYAISHDKTLAMSVDFARIHQFRLGYGYQELDKMDDGVMIWLLDLKTKIDQPILTSAHFI